MPVEALRADQVIAPQWDAPAVVGALMTTRQGGVSRAPYDTLNLGVFTGDDRAAVEENRRRVAALAGVRMVFVRQVHRADVVEADAETLNDVVEADVVWTRRPGWGCAVQVADCMPVLIAAGNGRAVAAAHAGWRGLAAGVVENALAAVCAASGCGPQDTHVWLGPCIGPREFEVGADVLEAFGADLAAVDLQRFVPRARADGSPAWLANLPQLARDRLGRAGVQRISGGGWRTVEDRSRFFSFRRDRITGRMAAAVWLRR